MMPSKKGVNCGQCEAGKILRQENHIKIAMYLIMFGAFVSIIFMVAGALIPEDSVALIEFANKLFWGVAGVGLVILVADQAFNKNPRYGCSSCGAEQK